MQACRYTNWLPEHTDCPETFDWNLLDSPKVTLVAWKIVMAIAQDMRTPERHLVPGLRAALRAIADVDC